jgi:uncharacterized protein YecA (UPF0149 family)
MLAFSMATPAQILANRQNAEKSSGPVTAEGRARVSHNATKLGLFSVTSFVRFEEQDIFNEFESGYLAELSPRTPLEQTLSREIVQAAWRLRRCASLEVAPPENMTDEELDRLQVSIDRARAAAQRTFHRSLKELRRLQDEHIEPAALMLQQAMAADALLMQEFEQRKRQFAPEAQQKAASQNSANQTQSEPQKTVSIPRGAPCPCKSGEKYKRCCGKNAPPVLFGAAA